MMSYTLLWIQLKFNIFFGYPLSKYLCFIVSFLKSIAILILTMSRQKLNPRLLSPKASDFNQFTFKQETPRESPSMMSISRDKPYISTK